jgi:hypothetical protein
MAKSKSQREDWNFVLFEVVVRQLYRPVEDREHPLGFQFLWLRVWSMTLQAQRISIGSQQFGPVSAVRVVAYRTSLLERRLMQDVLLRFLGSIRVASQTDAYGIRFWKCW